jgi:hypothetical protein
MLFSTAPRDNCAPTPGMIRSRKLSRRACVTPLYQCPWWPPSHLQLEVAELCEFAHPERPVGLKLVVVDKVKPQTAADLNKQKQQQITLSSTQKLSKSWSCCQPGLAVAPWQLTTSQSNDEQQQDQLHDETES